MLVQANKSVYDEIIEGNFYKVIKEKHYTYYLKNELNNNAIYHKNWFNDPLKQFKDKTNSPYIDYLIERKFKQLPRAIKQNTPYNKLLEITKELDELIKAKELLND